MEYYFRKIKNSRKNLLQQSELVFFAFYYKNNCANVYISINSQMMNCSKVYHQILHLGTYAQNVGRL